MKKILFVQILFICILGASGWYLFGLMKKAESNNINQKRVERNNDLVFASGAGIDIFGNEIEPFLVNNRDGTEAFAVAFLLRHDSLDNDLKFWNEAASLLSELDTVRLTAYCDDARCVEAVRKNPDMARFTILEYGAVVDMQAVFNSDANGEFCLRGDRTLKKIKWRDGTLTLNDIVNIIKLSGV